VVLMVLARRRECGKLYVIGSETAYITVSLGLPAPPVYVTDDHDSDDTSENLQPEVLVERFRFCIWHGAAHVIAVVKTRAAETCVNWRISVRACRDFIARRAAIFIYARAFRTIAGSTNGARIAAPVVTVIAPTGIASIDGDKIA